MKIYVVVEIDVDEPKEAPPLPTVESCIQTCFACPSQWDIRLSNGDEIYARYRHGYFSAYINSSDNPVVSWNNENDPNGGVMNTTEMFEVLRKFNVIQ